MKINRFEEAKEVCKKEFGKTLVPTDKVAKGDKVTGLKAEGLSFMALQFLVDYDILDSASAYSEYESNFSGLRETVHGYDVQFLENYWIDDNFSFGAVKCCEELVLMSVWDLENDIELGWIMLN